MTKFAKFAAAESATTLPPAVRRYMAANGAKGGAAGTRAQREAHRRAIRKAQAARLRSSGRNLSELARRAGIKGSTLRMRLRAGWTLERALGKRVGGGK